jgi:HAD superfamily hydrolase (TIGR01509 family)
VIKALIFDFDGLILDTEGPCYQSWLELYNSYGHRLPFDLWVGIIGTSGDTFDQKVELERRLGRKLNWEQIEPKRLSRELELIEVQSILPGVERYLEDARRLGLNVGLASSSSCKWVEGHLINRGLIGYFDCIRASDDVGQVKPAPDLYLAVLGALGLRAGEAIVLEDSPHGVHAAKRAGLFTVAVPNAITRRLDLEGADLRLESLTDLPLEELLVIAGRGDSSQSS